MFFNAVIVNFPTIIVIRPFHTPKIFRCQSIFKHMKIPPTMFSGTVRQKLAKNLYLFFRYQKFLETQSPKIFEIPFLREQGFFKNAKTKIFSPLDNLSLCLSLVYAPFFSNLRRKRSDWSHFLRRSDFYGENILLEQQGLAL